MQCFGFTNRHLPVVIVSILVLVLGMLNMHYGTLGVSAQEIPEVKFAGVPNSPKSWSEAYSPDPHEPLWLSSDSGMIDAGINPNNAEFADTGIDRVLGKAYLGQAHDIGSAERGLGWTKPGTRSGLTSDGLPYELPSASWRVANANDLSAFQDIGAPASIPGASVAVVQDAQGKRKAWIAISFDAGVVGNTAWQQHQNFLGGQSGKNLLMRNTTFRDGFDAYIYKQGSNAMLSAFAIDARGVWKITGGTKASDLFASQDLVTVQDDMMTFIRASLMLGGYNLNTDHWISLPMPGFNSVGSTATSNAENTLTMGELTGSPKINSNMFTLKFQGDANKNSEVKAWIRRQGQSGWEKIYTPFRVENDEYNRLEYVGFINFLAPATTYDFKITIEDPDGITNGDTATEKT